MTFSTPLYPFLVLEVGSGSQVPTFRNPTHLDPQVGPTRNLGVRQKSSWTNSSPLLIGCCNSSFSIGFGAETCFVCSVMRN
jgi:fumarylacetoacetate (FAA) hydrolase family protein